MTVQIVHHADYQAPLRPNHRFPMSKYGYLREALQARGLLPVERWTAPAAASETLIGGAHLPDYVSRAFGLTLTPAEIKRIGLPQNERVLRRTRLSAAGTLLAARLAFEHGIACNSAGGSHHARPEFGAGYCVFNDVAVALCALLAERAVSRAIVLDCDVHQGDGTALFFRNDPRVTTVSLHSARNYPFEKAKSDIDIPLEDGLGDADYLRALEATLVRLPMAEIVFYNAGVDVHAEDRLGHLALTDDGIRARERMVIDWARGQGIPLVGVIGGGYSDDPKSLAERHAILFEEAAR